MKRDFIVWCAGKWFMFHKSLPLRALRQLINSEDLLLSMNWPWAPSRLLKTSSTYKTLYTTEGKISIQQLLDRVEVYSCV